MTSCALSARNAEVYTADGKLLVCDINDASGMGGGVPTAVALPDGFYGWVAFRVSELTPYWNSTVPDNFDGIGAVSFDIRPSGFFDGGDYVLDECCLSDYAYGTPRNYTGPVKQPDNNKKRFIEEKLTGLLNINPEYTVIDEFAPTGEYAGIKAITYDAAERNGKKTKVFAYLAVPADADGSTPGIVLVHGGGGHAYLPWVKMWLDRGYAVIAPDVTGYFPTAVNAGCTETNGDWSFGLCGIFKEEGYTNAPNNDGMSMSGGDVDGQWMYHALSQVIIADSILMNDANVDASKVGVTGISWGGVITSLLVGYDNRLAFAIPIYGTGHLDEALSWMGTNFAGKETQELWSAADRFDRATMPILWLCWNDDNCFSLNSASDSYLDTRSLNGATRLAAINNMYHSHGSAWARPESAAFADSVVKGANPLPGLLTDPSGRTIDCEYSGKIKTAKLYYLTIPMTYSKHEKYGYTDTFMDGTWNVAMLKPSDGKITGTVPDNAVLYYIEMRNAAGVTVTSALIKP